MNKRDMALLIETEDALADMDQVLEQLTGYGHADGDFVNLDNVFNVIQNNSHKYYADNSAEMMQLFMGILMDRDKTAMERADILIHGTVRLEKQ